MMERERMATDEEKAALARRRAEFDRAGDGSRDLFNEAMRIRTELGDHALEAWHAALTDAERSHLERQWNDLRAAMAVMARIIAPRETE